MKKKIALGSSAARASAVRLRFLGVPGWNRGDEASGYFSGADALLLLILAMDGPANRVATAERLWPDSSPKRASLSLRQRIHRLKQLLGQPVIEGDEVIRLVDGVAHDLQHFDDGLRRDPGHGLGRLLDGVQCDDRGELADWLMAVRSRIDNQRRQQLADLAEAHAEAGRIAAALPYAERLAVENPLAEHAHRRLMRLHYQRGDRGAALAAYTNCQQNLWRLVELRPSVETEHLLVEVQRLTQPLGWSRAPVAPALLRPPVTVGRHEVAQAVLAAWSLGRLVVLTGPAGQGKSRLIQELCVRPAGIVVPAMPGDHDVPEALLMRLAEALPGAPATQALLEVLSDDSPIQRRHRLRKACQAAVSQSAEAGLRTLAVDDLQYADALSIETLLAVAGSGLDICWLLACRTGELSAPLRDWLAGPGLKHAQQIALTGIDQAAVQELLLSLQLPGLDPVLAAASLCRHCDGNPMFLLETLRATLQPSSSLAATIASGTWPVPDRVSRLLDQRIASLGPDARQLAQVVALAGSDFSIGLAAEVLKCAPLALADAWHALEQAQVVSQGGFVHDLVREACERSVPTPIRQAVHTDLARIGQAQGMPAARVAHHADAAMMWSLAADQYQVAARIAGRACDPSLQAKLAARASQCFSLAGDTRGAFGAALHRLQALRQFAALSVQLQAVEELVQLASTLDERIQALAAEAAVLIENFSDDRILVATSNARAMAGAALGAERALALERIEIRALARMGKHTDALSRLAAAVPMAHALHAQGNPLGPWALADFGCALMSCNRFAQARAVFMAALEFATIQGDIALQQESQMHMAWVLAYDGDIAAAARAYEEAMRIAQQMQLSTFASPVSRSILARTYKELGDFDQALTMLQELRGDYPDPSQIEVVATADADLADTYMWLAQYDLAAQALRALGKHASPTIRRGDGLARARLARSQGQKQQAEAWLERALEAAMEEGGVYGRFVVHAERTRWLPARQAAELAEAQASASEEIGLALTTWPLRVMACKAWLACGERERANWHAQAISEYFASRPVFVLYPPEVWSIVGEAFRATGQETQAIEAFGRGLSWVDGVALPRVPAEFQRHYRDQHVVHRGLAASLSSPPGRTAGTRWAPDSASD